MELSINDWHDWVRIVIMGFCVVVLGGLVDKFIKHRGDWNSKTKDYWYALTMWTLSGFVVSGQGIFWDYPVGPSLAFSLAAATVTLIGMLKRGGWGADDD